MQFLRKSALVLAASIFFFMLFGFGLLWGIERTFGTSDAMKSALKESRIYSSLVNDALEQAQKNEKEKGIQHDEIPLDRPEVRKIVSDAFPPSFMQTQTENLLDGVYNWLQGKTPNLAFEMNLTDAKTRLADGVAAYVTERASNLPTCGPNDIPQGTDVDPFNAPCLPPGADVNAIAAQARQELVAGEFMKDTQINAQDLKMNNGKTFAEEYKNAPAVYRGIVTGVYTMGVLALLLGVAVVFLSIDRRHGLRKVAILSVVVGSVLLFMSWLWGIALVRMSEEFAKSHEGSQPLQQKAMDVMQTLGNDVRAWWFWVGFVLLLLAIGGLVALRMTKPKDDLLADLPKPQPHSPAGESIVPAEHTKHSRPSKHTTHKRPH
jgi:hypothetical protein